MASIVKRNNSYFVVYNYEDESGKKKQKWESFHTKADAKKRKLQVEFAQENGTFSIPNVATIKDLMSEYVKIYGTKAWALSTYSSHTRLIENYIIPIIGDLQLSKITPRTMNNYYKSLEKVPIKHKPEYIARREFLSARQIIEIHKILRNAFNKAVEWELMSRNPVVNAILPTAESESRDIWTCEDLQHALSVCHDDTLSLAINIAFSCSLRMGEMLGLTWDCVDISEESIANGSCSIFVNKELQRVKRDALSALNDKGVIKLFPSIMPSTQTRLVLKEPKTKSSTRKVFLPKTVAKMLIDQKEKQEYLKDCLGDEYDDYNLVFASANGHPIEGRVINNALNKLIVENDLPSVVFHSLRHSSITYKLKLNGGDVKSVQGDSGHSQVKMVTDVYSHIIDEDRKHNAEKFENFFYSGNKEDQGTPECETLPPEATEPSQNNSVDHEKLIELLQKPEIAQLLSALAKNL